MGSPPMVWKARGSSLPWLRFDTQIFFVTTRNPHRYSHKVAHLMAQKNR